MTRLLLALWFCYGYLADNDVVGHGTVTQRTKGYAEQLAIEAAKDDAAQECARRRLAWYYDQLIESICIETESTWTCRAATCGHCVTP